MSTATAADLVIRVLPLKAIMLSETPIQKERRAQFNQDALKELAATIKANGRADQPITVRPNPHPEHIKGKNGAELFEVADGERRVLATRMAGLETIIAEVRELTDEQVEQMQIVTGLQKEGLHELVEAEGYETLQQRGLSIDEIAAKCGKSKATVYARMKLLALCKAGREAFRCGKISASVALLVSRIPVEKLQEEALAHILKPNTWSDEPLSYRATVEYIHKEFTLRLSEAPFPRDDTTLVPSAGACGTCPKRTGNQPELFGDIKGADVCTDTTCFGQKRSAWMKLQLREAKDTGMPVITGAAAKKVKSPWSTELNGYVRPSDKCETDPKRRTYAELLGKESKTVPAALLQNPESLKFSKVYKIEDVASALKKKGVAVMNRAAEREDDQRRSNRRYEAEEAQREKKRKFHRALLQAILRATPAKLGRPELEAIANSLFQTGSGDDAELYAALGMTYAKGTGFERDIRNLSDADLSRTIFALTLWDHVDDVYGSGNKPNAELLAAAKRFKVDPEKVRKEHEAAEAAALAKAAEVAPPAKAKKKAGKK